MSVSQPCWVYKSKKVKYLFVYLAQEGDFDRLPDHLKIRIGELIFVLKLDLTPDRKLAKEDAKKVLENLRSCGYHLQLPADLDPYLYFGD